jgi:hypothetical protein
MLPGHHGHQGVTFSSWDRSRATNQSTKQASSQHQSSFRIASLQMSSTSRPWLVSSLPWRNSLNATTVFIQILSRCTTTILKLYKGIPNAVHVNSSFRHRDYTRHEWGYCICFWPFSQWAVTLSFFDGFWPKKISACPGGIFLAQRGKKIWFWKGVIFGPKIGKARGLGSFSLAH